MEFKNKDVIISSTKGVVCNIIKLIEDSKAFKLSNISSKNTALIIIDMINGFAKKGVLKSERIEKLIPEIVKLSKLCDDIGVLKLVFADSHEENCPEFDSYPIHCLRNTYESDVVDEIKKIGNYTFIPKNSTNGFLEEKFQKWMLENTNIDTFIIVGDCTDICIKQFAISLKAWFNMNNRQSKVVVPINAIETYDNELHNGDVLNIFSLYEMIINGIEVVKSIQ